MKLSLGKPGFTPKIITLETQEECQMLDNLVHFAITPNENFTLNKEFENFTGNVTYIGMSGEQIDKYEEFLRNLRRFFYDTPRYGKK